MELTARDSTNKVVAIVVLGLLVLLTLSIVANSILALQNRYLSSTRETIVTPMAYDAPFVISEANSSPRLYANDGAQLYGPAFEYLPGDRRYPASIPVGLRQTWRPA